MFLLRNAKLAFKRILNDRNILAFIFCFALTEDPSKIICQKVPNLIKLPSNRLSKK